MIGRPDREWGEVVVAYVVGEAPPAELDALCLSSIARFKRPKDYVFVDALPKNNYGKILKTELRARRRGASLAKRLDKDELWSCPNPAKCPICGKPAVQQYRPFCSKRCADVDLNRWLSGVYTVPVVEEEDEDGTPQSNEPGPEGR